MDKDKILTEFANTIRAERSRRRWSQEQLAEKASLHTNCVGRIERCQYNPTLITIVKLANAFEIEPYKLMMFSDM